MAEEIMQSGDADRDRLSIDDDEQMRHCAKEWNVSEQWIRAAVAKVGVRTVDVEREVKR